MSDPPILYDNISYKLNADDKTAKVHSNPQKYHGEVTIPSTIMYEREEYTVTSIGSHAFYNCSGLTSVTIPNSVKSIGENAFYGCSSLTSVIIPNSVTSIGWYAFSGCRKLASITIPNSVESIGGYAFYNCARMTSVIIGESVKSIYYSSFANCPNLADVYCLAENVPSTDATAFRDSYIEDVTLHVPTASLNSYSKTEPWKNFKNLVTLSGEDVPKCAKPEISFENRKIKFTCETKDVIFISKISSADERDYYDSEIQLSQKYKISVYATKAGCLDSDVATREIILTDNGKAVVVGDVDGNGVVNVADHVELSKIIMGESQE